MNNETVLVCVWLRNNFQYYMYAFLSRGMHDIYFDHIIIVSRNASEYKYLWSNTEKRPDLTEQSLTRRKESAQQT